MTTTTPAASPATTAGNKSRFKKLAIAAAVFGSLALAYGVYYTTYAQYHEETDDAYVGANLIYVNAQVSGTVVALGADDNQPVKTGQPLVNLDPADAAIALADAEGRLGETAREIRQQFRSADTAQAVIGQRKTELQRAEDDLKRRATLADGETLSKEDLAHAKEAVKAAQDALVVAQKQYTQARTNIEGTSLSQHPTLLRARAAYIQAYMAYQRDEIQAPADGYIARRTVQVGQRVAPGSALLAVVPLKGAWIDANYKEPQLRHIQVGQAATVSTDIYGSHVEYKGVVVSISAGSGGAFSLLPPQNATGNWIKVVQRVPVRIALNPDELAKHPLRVGLSTYVNIDTHERNLTNDGALPLPTTTLGTKVFDNQLLIAEHKADAIIARVAGRNE
jgi:membrane fusion protein (multidrug efflux system)